MLVDVSPEPFPASTRLDRPVRSALTARQQEFAEQAGGAVRLRPAIGPFAAAADASPAALAELAALIGANEELLLVEPEVPRLPPGLRIVRSLATVQMIAPDPSPVPADPALILLGDDDGAEILALATLTRPGPFARETHRLGRFVGIREEGRLVAMAGERMRVDGFTEASAVCTHPEARGRGLARRLLLEVMRAIVARGETPFLHSYATNEAAITLYESIGFRRRALLQAITIARG